MINKSILLISAVIVIIISNYICGFIVNNKNIVYADNISKKQEQPLYIGFIPHSSGVKMVRKWQPLAEYLSRELGIEVEAVFKSSYRDVVAALSDGSMDICLTGAFVYILAKQEIDIKPVARRIINGSSMYSSIIIVRKDSKIDFFENLRNKRFAFTDKMSTTGYFLPVTMMRQRGIFEPEQYFSEVIFTGNHDSALLSVYMKSVEAGAVSIDYWRLGNSKIKKKLKILWQSAMVPLGPFVVRPGMDSAKRIKIKKAFLNIGKTADTLQLTKHLKINGFIETKDKDYDILRDRLLRDADLSNL